MFPSIVNSFNFTSDWGISEMMALKNTFNYTDLFYRVLERIPSRINTALPVTFLEMKMYVMANISYESLIQSPDRIASAILKYYHYLPLTPLVLWLYPLLFTLLFTLVILPIVSASTWFFWIITSLTLGALQVLYALYQFGMIGIDLAVLSVLKTFALIRSWVLSPYMMAYTASTHPKGQKPYQGRRRQWRETLAQATNYTDFLKVDILEPAEDPRRSLLLQAKHRHRRSAIQYMQIIFSAKQIQRLFVIATFPLRFIFSCLVHLVTRPKLPPRPPIPTSSTIQSKSPRRTKSCMEFLLTPFQVDTVSSASSSSDTTMGTDVSSPSAATSGASIPVPTLIRSSSTCHDMSRSITVSSSTSNPNNTLEHELGMIGAMLYATTQRLQEARIQTQQQQQQQQQQQIAIRETVHDSKDYGSRPNTISLQQSHNRVSEWNISETGSSNISHDNTSTILHGEDDHEPDNKDISSNTTTTTLPDLSVLKYLLTGIVKRNHLNVEKALVEDAQLVVEYGRHRLSKEAREAIQGYNQEVQSCLELIAEAEVIIPTQKPVSMETSLLPTLAEHLPMVNSSVQPISSKEEEDTVATTSGFVSDHHVELYDRIHLMRKMRHNMGRTALMLSGGGAQAMYHLGTIKALCESGLYNDIAVISGTSGGSITAAMCAIKTQEELLKDVCVTHVSTDYMLNGEMKKQNIRWFPKVVDMGWFWLQHGLLVDSKEFKRCCDFYFSDITFEEAFERTGKHVCITVSASRAGDSSSGGDGSQRLLLNHISTPHVTIASAVTCSCALPGVMAPGKLITKNTSSNDQEYFEVDGVEWIDGSVQADLPFKRISTLFNVSNYIVCQTNFHVVPFLHKPHHPSMKSWYWQIFQLCEWDIRSRALNLSRLGLFPKIFGQDISKVFKQKYHGDLTIVPRFTTMQVFGLKALINPTVEDMEVYIQNGQAATWPYISVIREMLRIESTIDHCIAQLTERARLLSPDPINVNDDVDSVTSADAASFSLASSSRVAHRHLSHVHKETETLKSKVKSLEQENIELRKKLDQLLQQAIGPSTSV